MAKNSILIIVPAYNEEKTITNVVRAARKYGSVVVIDDASGDKTSLLAKKAGAVVIRHKTNRGLGSALRTGFTHALKSRHDVVITLDGDGQHDPDDIPKFVGKINEGYGFVLGQRNLSKYPFAKIFGNFFLNIITNFISGTNLKDTESGFRAFRIGTLKKMFLKAERYEIAVEILFEVGKNNINSTNVDIASPIYVKGVGVFDGFRNLVYLLHRRERGLGDYFRDFRYVLKNWI